MSCLTFRDLKDYKSVAVKYINLSDKLSGNDLCELAVNEGVELGGIVFVLCEWIESQMLSELNNNEQQNKCS